MMTSGKLRQRTTPSLSGLRRTITIELGDASANAEIAELRHEVYARELRQHALNDDRRLQDELDAHNLNLVARIDGAIVGFVSITPPASPTFSIDKYFRRADLPFTIDAATFEVRLLTVLAQHRGRDIAGILIYAALRWVEAHRGTRIVAIGRHDIMPFYERIGLRRTGLCADSGALTYELMSATVDSLLGQTSRFEYVIRRFEQHLNWKLSFPLRRPAPCFHGGAFFAAIGESFDHLERAENVINADVLDAWFPPAPGVIATLQEHLPWLLRTSPPTGCDGLIDTIARVRGVSRECVLPGAGSSDLIFRAFPQWLHRGSRVLILDPTYGEYAHVLERVIGCRVDRFALSREHAYDVDLAALRRSLAADYELVVLVNPNSPTGRHVAKTTMLELLSEIPVTTRVWLDETYIEYCGTSESLESFAARSENVVVCKSLSKVYALSGVRAAYLCAAPHQLEHLRALTPPWAVGLPAQVAAVRALEDPAYYTRRYAQTITARSDLAKALKELGLETVPGVANFVLCHLPISGPDAAELTHRAREQGLFIRDARTMSARLGSHTVRIAVKDVPQNARMIEILRAALR